MLKNDYYCWDCVKFIAHGKPCKIQDKKLKLKKTHSKPIPVAYLDKGQVIQTACLGFKENKRAKEIRKVYGN